jgi:hypothetical protein
MSEPEVIDVQVKAWSRIEVDAVRIAEIIARVCHVRDKPAAKAANLIIDYLIAAASQPGKVQ